MRLMNWNCSMVLAINGTLVPEGTFTLLGSERNKTDNVMQRLVTHFNWGFGVDSKCVKVCILSVNIGFIRLVLCC